MIRQNSIQEIKGALVKGDIDQICADTQMNYGVVRDILSGAAVFKPEKHNYVLKRAIEIIKARNERISIVIKEIEDEWTKD